MYSGLPGKYIVKSWSGNMKYVKWITALLLLVFMTGIPITVAALDTGFTTEALSDEEIEALLNGEADGEVVSIS